MYCLSSSYNSNFFWKACNMRKKSHLSIDVSASTNFCPYCKSWFCQKSGFCIFLFLVKKQHSVESKCFLSGQLAHPLVIMCGKNAWGWNRLKHPVGRWSYTSIFVRWSLEKHHKSCMLAKKACQPDRILTMYKIKDIDEVKRFCMIELPFCKLGLGGKLACYVTLKKHGTYARVHGNKSNLSLMNVSALFDPIVKELRNYWLR